MTRILLQFFKIFFYQRIFIKITSVISSELRIENNTNKSRYNKFNNYFQKINYLV